MTKLLRFGAVGRVAMRTDGFDQTPILLGNGESARMFFPFFSETTFHGLRFGEWKFLFTQ
jgi:hypothetical protein